MNSFSPGTVGLYNPSLFYNQDYFLSGWLLKVIYLKFRYLFFHYYFDQLLIADATISVKNSWFFFPKKFWKKTPSKVTLKYSNVLFNYDPSYRQKKLCSKMWLMDQLFIKLGLSLIWTKMHFRFVLIFTFSQRKNQLN